MAAHFQRAQMSWLVAVWLLIPLLLLIKKKWVIYIFPVLLLVGAGIWINTTRTIWKIRALSGVPATRMALILGGVALFTALSGLAFRSKTIKERYKK